MVLPCFITAIPELLIWNLLHLAPMYAVFSTPVVADDLVSAATMPTLTAEDGQLHNDHNHDHDNAISMMTMT